MGDDARKSEEPDGTTELPSRKSEQDRALRKNVGEIRHEPGKDDERFRRGEDRDRWREAGLPERSPREERRDHPQKSDK